MLIWVFSFNHRNRTLLMDA